MAFRGKRGCEGAPDEVRPHLCAWQAERAAFERLAPGLARRRGGRWVCVHGGRVVGWARDCDRLTERMWKRFGGEVFFIGYVGGQPRPIRMPGFEVE